MFLYLPVKEELYAPELGRYCSFGLTVLWVTETRIEKVASISDISTLETTVFLLACRCTRLQLYPAHLKDIVEDAL